VKEEKKNIGGKGGEQFQSVIIVVSGRKAISFRRWTLKRRCSVHKLPGRFPFRGVKISIKKNRRRPKAFFWGVLNWSIDPIKDFKKKKNSRIRPPSGFGGKKAQVLAKRREKEQKEPNRADKTAFGGCRPQKKGGNGTLKRKPIKKKKWLTPLGRLQVFVLNGQRGGGVKRKNIMETNQRNKDYKDFLIEDPGESKRRMSPPS